MPPTPTVPKQAQPEPPPQNHDEWAKAYVNRMAAARNGELLPDPVPPPPPQQTYEAMAAERQKLRSLAASANGFGSYGIGDLH
jgi:hypothetical protein